MKFRSVGFLIVTAILTVCAGGTSARAESHDAENPAAAIQLVLETQQEAILTVDSPKDWWHDTKVRSWSVQRPFGPGIFDTTHTYIVVYNIDGEFAADWQVDTRAGTVSLRSKRPN